MLLQISKKPEAPERRLSHDKGPAPKPPATLQRIADNISPETNIPSVVSTPSSSVSLPSPPLSSKVIPPEKEIECTELIEKRKSDNSIGSPISDHLKVSVDMKASNAISVIKEAENQNVNQFPLTVENKLIDELKTEEGDDNYVKLNNTQINGNRRSSLDTIDHINVEVKDSVSGYESLNAINKRSVSKVPAPVRPVSMLTSFVEKDKKILSVGEIEKNRSRRSNSVSNRNRRRPSPPPLDKVLQIQATDNILGGVPKWKETGSSYSGKESMCYEDDRINIQNAIKNFEMKGNKKESTSNIMISSGLYYVHKIL